MDIKKFIIDYYHALLDPEGVKDFLHPNMLIQWQSPRGYLELDANELVQFSKMISKQYSTLRLEVTHIVAEAEDKVAARYINFITTPDNPTIEKELSHSIAIWQLKDGKLYRGFVMTHQAD